MQQHAANSSQQFAPRFSGAALHTPTQSFSEALQTPDSQGMNWAGSTSVKEEELAKSRLSDTHFNISELFFLHFIPAHLVPSCLFLLHYRLRVLFSHLHTAITMVSKRKRKQL
jgi:hypothetical protein